MLIYDSIYASMRAAARRAQSGRTPWASRTRSAACRAARTDWPLSDTRAAPQTRGSAGASVSIASPPTLAASTVPVGAPPHAAAAARAVGRTGTAVVEPPARASAAAQRARAAGNALRRRLAVEA